MPTDAAPTPTADTPTAALRAQGQSLWLDYIRRTLLTSGDLQRLIDDDHLRGMTSNPAIFEKAISAGTDYDEQLQSLLAEDPSVDVADLYERLAVADIQQAADILRPIYDQTRAADGPTDGVVSLEVSPHLAGNTEGTVEEAQRLWAAVDRPNLMIKVPATEAGIPAIERLIGAGINVNVTLMFSLDHYEAVAGAYLRGLQRAKDAGRDLGGIASVASFFVSRVAREVDHRLEEKGLTDAVDFDGSDVAIANAKMAYRRFQEVFHNDDPVGDVSFADLRAAGAEVQRPLWASTSTKDPSRSDVLYVEELVGPETVNTVPPKTLDAFRDHGTVRGATVAEDVEAAERVLQALADAGIDLDDVTETLQQRGVEKFVRPFDALLDTLAEKRDAIRTQQASV